jgi:hypothetical protein
LRYISRQNRHLMLLMHATNSRDQFIARYTGQKAGLSAGIASPVEILVAIIGAQNDETCFCRSLTDALNDFCP